MTPIEFDFLADQRGPRKMICENYVDRQWKKTAERKAKELESFRRREARANAEVKRMEKVELTDEMVTEVFRTICNDNNDDDDDYVPGEEEEEEEKDNGSAKQRRLVISSNPTEEAEEEEVETENTSKRRRLVHSSNTVACNASVIPERYRHIRDSIRKVRIALLLGHFGHFKTYCDIWDNPQYINTVFLIISNHFLP